MIQNRSSPAITFNEFNRLLRVLDLASLIHGGQGISIESLGDSGLVINAKSGGAGVGDDSSGYKHAVFNNFINGPFGVANTAISGTLVGTTTGVTIYARTPPRDGYLNLIECSPFFESGCILAIKKETHPFKEESTGNLVWLTGWFFIDVMHHCCIQQ